MEPQLTFEVISPDNSAKLRRLHRLDQKIIEFEEATQELGQVDSEFSQKVAGSKFPFCLEVIINHDIVYKAVDTHPSIQAIKRQDFATGYGTSSLATDREALIGLAATMLSSAIYMAERDRCAKPLLDNLCHTDPIIKRISELEDFTRTSLAKECFLGVMGAFNCNMYFYVIDNKLLAAISKLELLPEKTLALLSEANPARIEEMHRHLVRKDLLRRRRENAQER